MASWIPAALDVVLNRWDPRSGFIVTLVILVFSLLVTFAGIDITKVQPIEWLVIALSCLALSILWWRTRRPRAPKNKIGFGVAITFERSDHAQQLRSDFILALRDLLVESQLSQSFHFIELPASTARSIVNSEDAERLAHSCNLHFLLHGRARRRTYPEGTRACDPPFGSRSASSHAIWRIATTRRGLSHRTTSQSHCWFRWRRIAVRVRR